MKTFYWILLSTVLATPMMAQTKTLLNVDRSGVAIKGYDPVAFFTANKPVKGSREWESKHDGAIYRFSSEENKKAFDADPEQYEPAFGGYCAFGVSKNRLIKIDVDAFHITDGKLYLQYSKGTRRDFLKDTEGNLVKANRNWPELVEKKGK
jgi:YHS domain-containing protein